MTRYLSLVTAILASASLNATAQLDDPLDTGSNFASPFGPLVVSASADDGGRVTLVRKDGSADAGVDWLINGQTDLPLDASHDQLTLTPQAPVDGGYYVASLLFFQSDGTFITEKRWIEDTNLAALQTLASVKQFAADHQIKAAAQYRLRIRINPVGKSGAGFIFDQITASSRPDLEPE